MVQKMNFREVKHQNCFEGFAPEPPLTHKKITRKLQLANTMKNKILFSLIIFGSLANYVESKILKYKKARIVSRNNYIAIKFKGYLLRFFEFGNSKARRRRRFFFWKFYNTPVTKNFWFWKKKNTVTFAMKIFICGSSWKGDVVF